MIYIDFVGGSHGNFLQKVLNNLVNGTKELPFDNTGAAHKFINFSKTMFQSDHYSVYNKQKKLKKVIKINFQTYNLVKLTCLLMRRASGTDIDVDTLENNTVEKLSNTCFEEMLPIIYNSYKAQLIDYATTPSVPRHILREFFKFGFLEPEKTGLMVDLSKLHYQPDVQYIEFEFDWFYNFEHFVNGISRIINFFDIKVKYDDNDLRYFYNNFIKNNQYINVDTEMQSIFDMILQNKLEKIPKINLVQEAWLNAQLEKTYNIEMPFWQNQYFTHTSEVIDYIKEKKL
jgi:hypothetical protein